MSETQTIFINNIDIPLSEFLSSFETSSNYLNANFDNFLEDFSSIYESFSGSLDSLNTVLVILCTLVAVLIGLLFVEVFKK